MDDRAINEGQQILCMYKYWLSTMFTVTRMSVCYGICGSHSVMVPDVYDICGALCFCGTQWYIQCCRRSYKSEVGSRSRVVSIVAAH